MPATQRKEEGGRVYDVRRKGVKLEGEAQEGWIVDIVPGRSDVDLRKLHVGDRIWKTNDPALDKRLRQTYETEAVPGIPGTCARQRPSRTAAVDLVDRCAEGHDGPGGSELELEIAQKRPLSQEILEEQLGRLGGTVFQLEALDVDLYGDVIVPIRELNSIRRRAVELLAGERPKPPVYVKRAVSVYGDAAKPAAPVAR